GRVAQPGWVAARQIEQCVRVGDSKRMRAALRLNYLVAGFDQPLPDNPHVKAGPVMADQQRGHLGFAKPQADAVAGDPRLSDFELGRADPVPVADAHLVVRQAVDGQVLPELAVTEVVPAEMTLPVPIRPDLIDQHGSLLAAVPVQVALTVTVDVEPTDH